MSSVFFATLGRRLRTGTIMDASIIDAPSSTKNMERARDPEIPDGGEKRLEAALPVGQGARPRQRAYFRFLARFRLLGPLVAFIALAFRCRITYKQFIK